MNALKTLIALIVTALALPALAQQPVKVRVAWIVPVTNLASFMYTMKDVLVHHGKSYTVEAT